MKKINTSRIRIENKGKEKRKGKELRRISRRSRREEKRLTFQPRPELTWVLNIHHPAQARQPSTERTPEYPATMTELP